MKLRKLKHAKCCLSYELMKLCVNQLIRVNKFSNSYFNGDLLLMLPIGKTHNINNT